MVGDEIKISTTSRRFWLGKFRDANGELCSIQQSSSVDPRLWLGVDVPNPMIFPGDNTGWHPYKLPENVQCTTRMYLNVEQVKALIPILQKFVDENESEGV